MRLAPLFLAVTMSSSSAFAAVPADYLASLSDGPTLDTPFSVHSDTQIPGKTLKPGGYTLILKDHLSDRAIIQVISDSGKVESTFLAVFNSGLKSRGGSGPIALETEKGHDALRGFSFPGGRTVEFVYPKAEAATLVTKSSEQIIAIDPASDNLRNVGKVLSNEDAQIVTLWSLQATRLPAGQKGIAAKKYVAPQIVQTYPVPEPVVARNVSPKSASSALVTSIEERTPARQPIKMASNRIPAIKTLPHTASNMPLLILAAFVSFAGMIGLRFRRLLANAL